MALPFGLLTSLRVFTQVVGTMVTEVQRQGALLFAYLDDWLILWNSHIQADTKVGATISLFKQSGWVINWDKLHNTPSQALVYLGKQLNLNVGRAFPSKERREALRGAVSQLLEAASSPSESWLQVVGLLAS